MFTSYSNPVPWSAPFTIRDRWNRRNDVVQDTIYSQITLPSLPLTTLSTNLSGMPLPAFIPLTKAKTPKRHSTPWPTLLRIFGSRGLGGREKQKVPSL